VKHLILLCTVAFAIAGVGAQPAVKPHGLKIFYHGKIFTSNQPQLLIEDGGVAVLGNIIVKVGSSRSVLQLQNPGAELTAEDRGFHRFVVLVHADNFAIRKLLKQIGDVVSATISGGVAELAFVRRREPRTAISLSPPTS